MNRERPFGPRWIKAQQGFTLIEILVAIAITAVIFSLVYGSFSTSFAVSDRIMEDREFYRTVRLTLSKMIHELDSAYYLEKSSEETLFMGSHFLVDGYPHDSIRFTSLSHYRRGSDAPESDLNLIKYHLEQEPEGATSLLIHEEESNLYSLTPETQTSYELGKGFKGLGFRYFDGKSWHENWDSTMRKGLPKAVEIKLILEDHQKNERIFTTKTTMGLVE